MEGIAWSGHPLYVGSWYHHPHPLLVGCGHPLYIGSHDHHPVLVGSGCHYPLLVGSGSHHFLLCVGSEIELLVLHKLMYGLRSVQDVQSSRLAA